MPSEPQAVFPAQTAARLLGGEPREVSLLGGGGNSRVYRVSGPEGTAYAMKAYFQNPEDPRDRLGVEFAALRFLWERGVRAIPRPLATEPEAGLGLLEFIEGARIFQPSEGDIDAGCAFLAKLHRLSADPGAAALPIASEARFSFKAVAENIQERLEALIVLPDPSLGAFLADELLPVWQALHADCRERSRAWAIPFDQDLPVSHRTLSPSDFGFHNALRRQDQVVFLDFEYFGWDDPAKLVADFLLHPGMDLAPGLRERFAEGLLARITVPGLRRRTRLAYPLFGMKWCAILLNEFLPNSLQRRRFAAPSELSPAERQANQLAKCRMKLQQVLSDHDSFHFFHVD